jgi:hypothetical protein
VTGKKRSSRPIHAHGPGLDLLHEALGGGYFENPLHREYVCPVHDDRNPSLAVDYRIDRYGRPNLFVWCRTCGANLIDVCHALGLETSRILWANWVYDDLIGAPKWVAPLPRSRDILHWHRSLLADKEALDYLRGVRGIHRKTIEAFTIGHDGERFTLPVINENGRLVNLRRYDPDHVPKMLGLAGRRIRLYPDVPADGRILFCEGEWDALIGRQHGLPTVTSTGGVMGWKPQWGPQFRGRQVAIVYDCDQAGRDGASWMAERLLPIVADLKVVDLGLGDGEDLTDWFVLYGRSGEMLLKQIRKTPDLKNR